MDNDLTVGRTNVTAGGVWQAAAASHDDDSSSESVSSSRKDSFDTTGVIFTAASSLKVLSIAATPLTSGFCSASLELAAGTIEAGLIPPQTTPQTTPQVPASLQLTSNPTPLAVSWPTSAESYILGARIGRGAFASVYAARIKKRRGVLLNEEMTDINRADCAIKIMDLEHVNININDIRLEVQSMRLSSHPNVLICHTSFVRDTDLWLVTQLMIKGSSLHCLQSARARILANAAAAAPAIAASKTKSLTNASIEGRDAIYDYWTTAPLHPPDDGFLEGGLTSKSSIIKPECLLFESHITYILYETIHGLKYIHDNGQIHRDVKAGNILLDSSADVRIADFGVSSWLIDGGNRREHTTTFVGTPCWMAPEVMEQVDGYDYKADIWSLGITALELCKGYAPYAKFSPMKVLLLTIQEDPPSLDTYNDGDNVALWSDSFRSMVNLCLQKDPNQRPTCQELLAHRHFRPLVDADGRANWRIRTKVELCNVVVDVDKSLLWEGATDPFSCSSAIDSTKKKDRPAGTSWILPLASPMEDDSTSLFQSPQWQGEQFDFFDEFEEQTGGENFNRERLLAQDVNKVTDNNNETKEMDSNKDDIANFFDEFEKTTGGENFRPGRQA